MSDYNIRAIKKKFSEKGIFYTSDALAKMMLAYAGDISKVTEVYDPTCGDGALLSVFGDGVAKFGQELDPDQLAVAASSLVGFTGVSGDTLKEPGFPEKKFDLIMGNPPFSVSWDPPDPGLFCDERFKEAPVMPPKSKADYAFLLHIMHYLSDTGVAVVLNFPGILYRGNAEGKIRQWFIEKNFIDKVIRIPGKSFIDTDIETAMLVLRKNKTTTDIEFIDLEKDLKKIVDFESIKKNDFCLSVTQYCVEHIEKEIVDPIKLRDDARSGMIKRLRADLDVDRLVCGLEGYDFGCYIDDLQAVLDSYRGVDEKA